MTTYTSFGPDGADVIVVGGGFAGLTAAREVTRAGRTALIVEATDRLGGRTWTTERFGTYVELGGTDVHWLQPHVWSEVSRYGLEIEEFAPPTDIILLEDGVAKNVGMEGVVERMSTAMSRLADLARHAFERPHDLSFCAEQAFAADGRSLAEELASYGLPRAELDAVSSFWTAAYQGPLENGSLTLALRWLALAGWDWEVMIDVISRYKIVGGTRRLVEAIYQEAKTPVLYHAVVRKVETVGAGVRVELTDGRTLTGGAVVCAVPINALGDIEFVPGLPASTARLAREGQVSRGLKVVMKVRGTPEPYMAFAPTEAPFVLCQYDRALEDGSHLAVAFGGDAAAVDGDDSAAVQRAVRQWFPHLEIEDVAHHSWTRDPHFRGTWAVPSPGQVEALLETTEIGGRVVFAGADLSTGSYALIDGAIDTGMRAARKAVSALSAGDVRTDNGQHPTAPVTQAMASDPLARPMPLTAEKV